MYKSLIDMLAHTFLACTTTTTKLALAEGHTISCIYTSILLLFLAKVGTRDRGVCSPFIHSFTDSLISFSFLSVQKKSSFYLKILAGKDSSILKIIGTGYSSLVSCNNSYTNPNRLLHVCSIRD